MNQHLGGAHYFLTGLRMLNQRGLRRYVIIPLIINIVLFVVMLYLGIHYFSHLTTWLETLLPSWLHWLNGVLWVLFIISSLIVITYTDQVGRRRYRVSPRHSPWLRKWSAARTDLRTVAPLAQWD